VWRKLKEGNTMSIIAQVVGGAYAPVNQTSVTGTSAQVITTYLTVGGQINNGRPFKVWAQGYVKAHGATQTINFGLQGQVGNSTFSGTSLILGTASGTLTAGTFYPFLIESTFFADNTSGIMSGYGSVADGVTPTYKILTKTANLLTGVTFGSAQVGTNVTNPLASAQLAADCLQFAVSFTNTVADTSEIVTITSFYATGD
jgi:hypothetical protein